MGDLTDENGMDERTARLLSTTDAEVWAEEYLKVITPEGMEPPPDAQAVMVTWFANAIETGRSAGYHQAMEETAVDFGG